MGAILFPSASLINCVILGDFLSLCAPGAVVMRRLCLFVGVLFLGIGCAWSSPKEQWDSFKREMADDIALKGDFVQTKATDDPAAKPHN
jgi:hypothetical protein